MRGFRTSAIRVAPRGHGCSHRQGAFQHPAMDLPAFMLARARPTPPRWAILLPLRWQLEFALAAVDLVLLAEHASEEVAQVVGEAVDDRLRRGA